LYAYEINLDYTGTISSVAPSYFLGSQDAGEATYSYNEKNNIVSVYGSRLDSTQTGVSSSGELFNITYDGTVSLRYTLEISSDGTETYTYYNTTPVTVVVTSGGGGGGGGGGAATPNQFSISPNILKVTLNQGETKRETVTIKNNLNSKLTIESAESGDLKKFIAGFTPDFPIPILSEESLELDIDFFSRQDEVPETYVGQIAVTGGSTTKTINTIIEIQEKKPLFDVTLNLDKDQYSPEENVIAAIGIENYGDLKDIDLLVFYALKDFNGNTLASKEESYAIENYKLEFVGKLKLPKGTENGDYVFYVKATYPQKGTTATASQIFTVGDFGFSPVLGQSSIFLAVIIALAVIAVIVVTIILFFNTRKNPAK
ncbi:MAG: hypothetical protein KJ600_04140, partial [Nanoarchaeota archaeon]|nr:hypothetical protein [Nanoarchaeota archaeon]